MGCSQSSAKRSRKANITAPALKMRTLSRITKPAQQGNKKVQKNDNLENNNPVTDAELDDYLCRGQRYLAKGRRTDAFDMFCKARDIMEETMPDSLDLATIYYELGRMLISKNQNEAGTSQLRKALMILDDVLPCHEAAQVLNVLSTSPVVSTLESLEFKQRAEDIINELQQTQEEL